jgi:hypothetical protein
VNRILDVRTAQNPRFLSVSFLLKITYSCVSGCLLEFLIVVCDTSRLHLFGLTFI